VVPPTSSADEVGDWPTRLAAGPPLPTARSAARSATARHDLESSLAFEAEMMALTGASEDHRNAVDSFIAKRKPVFEGR
jgi:2-(1,2-epoxy-1,2-dihydrophenyl)acetyl-CoA isomerase